MKPPTTVIAKVSTYSFTFDGGPSTIAASTPLEVSCDLRETMPRVFGESRDLCLSTVR